MAQSARGWTATISPRSSRRSTGADFDMFNIRMNSPGGNVFQGMSIVSAILSMNTPVCVHIDGIAASMAAVVAVAADRVCMMDFAKMMIHDPYFTGESGKATSPKQKKALRGLPTCCGRSSSAGARTRRQWRS